MPVIPAAVAQEVLERDGYKCVYCGDPLLKETFSLDHFVPVVSKGTHDASNLKACCLTCNLVKNRRVFESVSQARLLILHLLDRPYNEEPGVAFEAHKKKRPLKRYGKKRYKPKKPSYVSRRSLALWRDRNREKINGIARAFYQKTKARRVEQMKERYRSDPTVRVRQQEARDQRIAEAERVSVEFLRRSGIQAVRGDEWVASCGDHSKSGLTLYMALKRLS
ncbi:MAG TPA: HNH endonuclease, partial [Acidobacteriota bacterium]|nr:HNH endonuclease [Acidobacteriota bacterium]